MTVRASSAGSWRKAPCTVPGFSPKATGRARRGATAMCSPTGNTIRITLDVSEEGDKELEKHDEGTRALGARREKQAVAIEGEASALTTLASVGMEQTIGFFVQDTLHLNPAQTAKTVGGMAQTVYRGVERVRSRFILTMAASNLARLPRLLGA